MTENMLDRIYTNYKEPNEIICPCCKEKGLNFSYFDSEVYFKGTDENPCRMLVCHSCGIVFASSLVLKEKKVDL